MSHKRAPNGHHIEQWADGTYHVYCGGECLDELLSKTAAIELAWSHTCRTAPAALTAPDKPAKAIQGLSVEQGASGRGHGNETS